MKTVCKNIKLFKSYKPQNKGKNSKIDNEETNFQDL